MRVNGAAEVTDITVNPAATLSGGENYRFSSPSDDYYVWYTVDGVGADPELAGAAGILVELGSGDSAAAVGAATAAQIDAVAGLSATSTGDIVTLTNAAAGSVTDAADNNTGFAFNVTTQGTDGNLGDISIVIGEDLQTNINVNGFDVFLSNENIFDILRRLKNGLEENDSDIISEQIERFNDSFKQVLNARSKIGSKINSLEATENHWIDFKLSLEQRLADTEGVDFTRAMTDLMTQEAAYEASLAAAANIIQPSLINFLR